MELHKKYPTCSWIEKTTPKKVIEGVAVIKDIKVSETKTAPKVKPTYSKPFKGFEDIVYFTIVDGLGYYCSNAKGFSKARRTFLYTIEDSDIFELNKATNGIDRPTEFPCIVQFHVGKDNLVQILYTLNSKSVEMLKDVSPVKTKKH